MKNNFLQEDSIANIFESYFKTVTHLWHLFDNIIELIILGVTNASIKYFKYLSNTRL